MGKEQCVAVSYGNRCTNKATTICQWGGALYKVCNGHIRGEKVGKL